MVVRRIYQTTEENLGSEARSMYPNAAGPRAIGFAQSRIVVPRPPQTGTRRFFFEAMPT
jgi:hypothetical protein